MVTDEDILAELKKIKKLLKGMYSSKETANGELSKEDD